MVGCCFCTKAGCYQDKDQVEWYVGGQGAKAFEYNGGEQARMNGSDYERRGAPVRQNMPGIEEEEKQDNQLIDIK